MFELCMPLPEKKPSMPPRKRLPPLLGMALSEALPEPDSAPMPLVSICSSSMVPWSLMYPTPLPAPMKYWLRKPS